jgi:hypothetical protein
MVSSRSACRRRQRTVAAPGEAGCARVDRGELGSVSLAAPSARVARAASSRRSSRRCACSIAEALLLGQSATTPERPSSRRAGRSRTPGCDRASCGRGRDLVMSRSSRRDRPAGRRGSPMAPAFEFGADQAGKEHAAMSPARLITLRPAPRSTKMAMWPVSTTNRPVTGVPFALSTSPSSSCRRDPWAASRSPRAVLPVFARRAARRDRHGSSRLNLLLKRRMLHHGPAPLTPVGDGVGVSLKCRSPNQGRRSRRSKRDLPRPPPSLGVTRSVW